MTTQYIVCDSRRYFTLFKLIRRETDIIHKGGLIKNISNMHWVYFKLNKTNLVT